MTPPPSTPLYTRHRFPADIISHCVWRYCRCSLRYRNRCENSTADPCTGVTEAAV